MLQKKLSEKEICTKIISMVWKNPRFKEKLSANPTEALKGIGIDAAHLDLAGTDLTTWVLQLPACPIHSPTLSDRELAHMARFDEPPFTMKGYEQICS